jgi:hypothetical protein
MLIEQNMTYQEIGDAFGITRQAVYWRLKKAGLKPGSQAKHRKASLIARLSEAHARIMSREATVAEEAERLGYTQSGMRSVMLRNGMPIRVPQPEPEHGTRARYQKGCKCDECKRSHADHQASLRGLEPPNHGTESGYINYACRCQPCKEAARAAVRARLAALRQRREIAA